jgi:hypothetical protein
VFSVIPFFIKSYFASVCVVWSPVWGEIRAAAAAAVTFFRSLLICSHASGYLISFAGYPG